MNQRAIPPYRFVCSACGKTSGTRYGFDDDHDPGWDESCMLRAILCEPSSGAIKWRYIPEPKAGVHYTVEIDPDDTCLMCDASGPLTADGLCAECDKIGQ